MNPFDMWEGANFKLKIRQVEGYRNYDKSEFEAQAPISKDDDVMETIWKNEYALQELVGADKFKTYDELKAKLVRVLGLDGNPAAARNKTAENNSYDTNVDSAPRQRTAPAPKIESSAFADDDDENMEFFKNLADED
jgi:hypothetical protein